MFYSYFESLCNQKGVSVNKACQEMGVSRSVAAKWKSTKTGPSRKTLEKISKYFNISTDELLQLDEESNKKTATIGDGVVAINKLMELIPYLTPQQAEFLLPQVQGLVSSQPNQGVPKQSS